MITDLDLEGLKAAFEKFQLYYGQERMLASQGRLSGIPIYITPYAPPGKIVVIDPDRSLRRIGMGSRIIVATSSQGLALRLVRGPLPKTRLRFRKHVTK